MFEKKTGIKVNYEEFETNEEMYTIVATGAVVLNTIFPSGRNGEAFSLTEGLLQQTLKVSIAKPVQPLTKKLFSLPLTI